MSEPTELLPYPRPETLIQALANLCAYIRVTRLMARRQPPSEGE